MDKKIFLTLLVICTMFAYGCGQQQATGNAVSEQAMEQPNVMVSDQEITSDSKVNVDDVVAAEQGWIVIHADNNGKPGTIIGYTPVQEGDNPNVWVSIDESMATPKLYAMLHVDEGTVGMFEYPGADMPVMSSNNIVMQGFMATKPMIAQSQPSATNPTPTTNPAPEATSAMTGETITLSDRTSQPVDVTINVGGSVTFKSNAVKNSHVILIKELDQRSTGMEPGDSFTFKFDKAGKYTYRDVWVASLTGTITVE